MSEDTGKQISQSQKPIKHEVFPLRVWEQAENRRLLTRPLTAFCSMSRSGGAGVGDGGHPT